MTGQDRLVAFATDQDLTARQVIVEAALFAGAGGVNTLVPVHPIFKKTR